MEQNAFAKAPARVQVILRYRKSRSAWQMSYRNPSSGKFISRLVGSDPDQAANAAENWQIELNEKQWPERAISMRRRYSHRKPVTTEEFERMIVATPIVVGEEFSDSWIDFLRALWSGMRLQSAFQSHSLNHKLLTMSLANVQRVIAEIGRAAGIHGGAVTSHEIRG